MPNRFLIGLCLPLWWIGAFADEPRRDDFERFLRPFFAENCFACHGETKTKGKVNFEQIASLEHLLAKPELIQTLIEVLDASEMPPEEEPALDEPVRVKTLVVLKAMLRQAASGVETRGSRLRRLNRFQYNNSIRDLFQLTGDVFPLPEKLMTRHGNYLNARSNRMPDRVEAECRSLHADPGFTGVTPFPKDLRAAHGFDNQANQLTLSPLLLDTFLKLAVSILESPDFNEESVGIWSEFFETPDAGAGLRAEVEKRLEFFLTLAFRGGVDPSTRTRYADYSMSKLEQGMPFPDAMRKVASAALSSPMFLYRHRGRGGEDDPFALASNLSFFLWGSCPDLELLRLAERGELAEPERLNRTIDRMLSDPKIERFLDAFPSQWMQLENVLAATPDPNRERLFSLDKDRPASLQMVLEPLLLFDAVFIENRPIQALIAPTFGYRSEFLDDWYTSDLEPPPVYEGDVAAENRAREEHRHALEDEVKKVREERETLERAFENPIRERRIAIDLSSGQAQWEVTQARLAAEAVVLRPWKRIGPFPAGNLDEAYTTAFLKETDVDLDRTHDQLTWTDAAEFIDGKVHELRGENSATYLHRTILSESVRPLEVSLGSDDSFKLWLNGKLVAENRVSRGVAPDQDQARLDLAEGENELLLKVVNGGGGYGFYFKARQTNLPGPVLAALKVDADARTEEQRAVLAGYYLGAAPELAAVRREIDGQIARLTETGKRLENELNSAPKPQGIEAYRLEAQRRFDDEIRGKVRSRSFERLAVSDPRYGGVMTSAAVLTMTSGPTRTHPIARGAWVIEVIFNDPPPPPPNDVPPLSEDDSSANLTIRERFAKHRENPDCAGCHSRLDPLGFALENFDITGRWRDRYENGRDVDPSGTLLRKYAFDGVVGFKESLIKENRRFARAFTGHLLRFALSRELTPADSLTIDAIVERAGEQDFKLKALIREVILSDGFVRSN